MSDHGPSEAAPARRPKKPAAAAALRLAGASYGEIADALEYTDARSARHAVEDWLAVQAGDPATREQLRIEAVGRLERLLRGTWAKATTPDHPEHIPAGKFALAVIDRVIRLQGLDAPAEVVVHTPTMHEIDQWVATVTGSGAESLRALEDPNIIDLEPEDVAG